ncbi:MAG TPA: MFS transporter [Anaerolineaceae bacterium]|nr:MFS transporter [Anaerolineaceae bacterium]
MQLLNRIKKFPKAGMLLLAYAAFIALGMPDGLLGVAWPSIRAGFSLPLDALAMFFPATVSGYMVSSFSSGPLVTRFGIGRILAASCTLTGIALIGYTLVPAWWMMVALGVLAGLGAGAIDAGLNTYVAAHFNERHMQWLHAFYGVGVTLGPVIMTLALSWMNSWRAGYRTVGGFQLFMAVAFVLTLSMWNHKTSNSSEQEPKRLTDFETSMFETMRKPAAWLSALLFFVYVGVEVSYGTWTYSLLVESRGIDPEMAGAVAGSYWATFTIGRMLAGLYAQKAGIIRTVTGSLAAALAGTLLLIWNAAPVTNLLAVALVGLAIAPVFAALMSATVYRVEAKHASNTIGMQMAASGLGTAVIPGALGVLAARFSLEAIPICLALILLTLFGLFRLSLEGKKLQADSLTH